MDPAMATTLKGARVALGPSKAALLDVTISRDRITSLAKASTGLDLTGHLILPGLINAHDHLEFNLFPKLGRGPYPNATEWARDVYHPDKSPAREHRRVPRCARLFWGGLKNLVSGVTTVCHHNPYEPKLFDARFPVRVLREFGWAHSLAFSPDLKRRYRRNPQSRPFIMHAAEATDASGGEEIAQLDQMGVLRGSVLVHGVGIDASGLRLLRKRGASLIACPVSNVFNLGRTLKRSAFTSGIPIALGTDSAITATGDILDALRFAHRICHLSAVRLYKMVTTEAAAVLRLRRGEGAIGLQAMADLIAIRDTGATPAKALLAARRIELVMVGGRIRLISDRLAKRIGAPPHFERIHIAGRGRMLVDAPVGELYRQTAPVLGGKLRLAGKAVSL
jgi:cytosine/adenosine deaminase-related metal-dependent hydrolase